MLNQLTGSNWLQHHSLWGPRTQSDWPKYWSVDSEHVHYWPAIWEVSWGYFSQPTTPILSIPPVPTRDNHQRAKRVGKSMAFIDCLKTSPRLLDGFTITNCATHVPYHMSRSMVWGEVTSPLLCYHERFTITTWQRIGISLYQRGLPSLSSEVKHLRRQEIHSFINNQYFF